MSERSENLKLIISGDGKLLRTEIGRTEREIKTFGSRVSRTFTGMRNSINSGLKRALINPITGVASVAGIGMLAKGIIDFDAKLTRLGIQGDITGANLVKMRKEILDTAFETGQSRESILEGIDAIVERTGDIAFADKIKKEMGIAATASGAAMADIGALSSNLNQKMKIDASGIMDALNILTVQGKAGAFTLSNQAALGERLFASAGRLGMSGMEDLKRFGALMQVARMGTGSSEQATTSIERIIANIIDKQDVIRSKGFEIFSNRDKQEFKSIDEIIKGIIVATRGNQKLLGNIFGDEGIRGVTTLVKMYSETGGFDLYDKLVNADAERAGQLMEDFARYAASTAFKLQRATEVGKRFADSALSKPITDFTDAIQKLTSDPAKLERFNHVFENLGQLASTVGKALMFSAEGWSQIVDVIDKTAERYGDRKSIDVRWNTIPDEKRKELSKKFNIKPRALSWGDDYYAAKGAAVADYMRQIKNENHINMTVNIDAEKNTSTRTDSLDTTITAHVNRGRQNARQ